MSESHTGSHLVGAIQVKGTPTPQGSTRAFAVKGQAFTTSTSPGPLARYRNDIANTWDVYTQRFENSLPCDRCPWTWGHPEGTISRPVAMRVTFQFARPLAHLRPINTKRSSPELREDAPLTVTKKPDLDKLLRAVNDALTGRLYADDSQIYSIASTKVYGPSDLTLIEWWYLRLALKPKYLHHPGMTSVAVDPWSGDHPMQTVCVDIDHIIDALHRGLEKESEWLADHSVLAEAPDA